MGNGNPHVGITQLRQYRAVDIFHHGMDDALRMDDHIQLLGRHVEEELGLDQLQPLVHERGRVDRDLAAHRPLGMLAGLLGRGGGNSLRRPGPERPARGGKDQASDGTARIHASSAIRQALEDGIVLAVDRQQRDTGLAAGGAKKRASHDNGFLVGQQHRTRPTRRRQRGRQARRPDDGGHDRINARRAGHLDQLVGADGQTGRDTSRTQPCLESGGSPGIRHSQHLGSVPHSQRQQLVDIAMSRERVHPITVGVAGHDIERAVTNGTGGAQNGDGLHEYGWIAAGNGRQAGTGRAVCGYPASCCTDGAFNAPSAAR